MTKNRKATTRSADRDAAQNGETLDRLYVAHQVHALAQLLIRQLAQRQTAIGGMPTVGAAHSGAGFPWAPQAGSAPVPFAQGEGPGLIYWYP